MNLSPLWLFLSLLLLGCLSDEQPKGLKRSPEGSGPRVIFELEGHALPEIPFPNDLVTRPDPDSPTGLRLNISQIASTQHQADLRKQALELDGFGTFVPVTIRFDAPLDLARLYGRGRSYNEDPILLLNLSEGPHFGERVHLDLGRGNFPLLRSSTQEAEYAALDPRRGENNLLFETVDEDHDGDGLLSLGEDTDGDGRLDQPNLLPEEQGGELLSFYERETDTLILRPVLPLRPGEVYAVVITDQVKGLKGQAIRSPFEFIHHIHQTKALSRLSEALGPYGISLGQVSFVWTFTTQSARRELELLRDGLQGQGPFKSLMSAFPPDVSRVEALSNPPKEALLEAPQILEMLEALSPFLWSQEELQTLIPSYEAVDSLVSGRYVSPNLLGPGRFQVDPQTRELQVEGVEVPFWCVLPKKISTAPAPVVLFAHDCSQTWAQSLALAGHFAGWGLATCAIDAPNHGLQFSPEEREQLKLALAERGLEPLWPSLRGIRTRNPEGELDNLNPIGPDPIKARDRLRQTALDWLQFLRILRSFDGQRRWLPGLPWVKGLVGDFDGDTLVDLGGTRPIYILGQGFGGMVATLLGGLSPELERVALISAGGGFTDMGLRSQGFGFTETLLLPAMGPLLLGYPTEEGFTALGFLVAEGGEIFHQNPLLRRGIPISERLPGLLVGDQVVLENLRSGEHRETFVDGSGAFRIATPADAGDPLRLRIYGVGQRLKLELDHFEKAGQFQELSWEEDDPLMAIVSGEGLRRQSPEIRRWMMSIQTLLESGDPINYAAQIALEAEKPKDLLMILSAGDQLIPLSTGQSLARAAGLLPLQEIEPGFGRSANQVLIDHGVTLGLAHLGSLVDVDDLSEGLNGAPRLEPPLRHQRELGGATLALRIARLSSDGQHGFELPKPLEPWDGPSYLANLLGQFFSQGRVDHRPCLLTGECK